MKDFHEGLRYEYNLTPDSIVIDAGAHMGNFSRAIGRRYDCRIFAFEPVARFCAEATKDQCEKTQVFPVGLSESLRFAKFKIQGDSTGEYANGTEETVVLIPADKVFSLLTPNETIALLKLNIEGGEHNVLERLIKSSLQSSIDNIQVQWHCVHENAMDRMVAIRHELSKTHALTYQNNFVWESWQRK